MIEIVPYSIRAMIITLICTILCIIKRKCIQTVILTLYYEMMSYKCGFFGAIDAVRYRNITDKFPSMPQRKGEVAIITGGGTGIGLGVVKGLVRCGMKVVIGVLDPRDFADLLKEEGFLGNVEILRLDVSSMRSVETFVSQVSKKHECVNLLINNAAILYKNYSLTPDGFETVWATNYLGHFYLTHLLMPSLNRAGEVTKPRLSRIVNVASCEHRMAQINFEDVGMKESYIKALVYSQSKLATVMFALYFDSLLKYRRNNVRCYAVSPGVVDTGILKNHPLAKYLPLSWSIKKVFKTKEAGAMDVVYTCLSEEIESKSGLYYHNCKVEKPSDYSLNKECQSKLFKLSCDMIGVKTEAFGN